MMPRNNNDFNILLALFVLVIILLSFCNPVNASSFSNASLCNDRYLGISENQTGYVLGGDYIVGYDETIKSPIWVAYSVDRHNLRKLVGRSSSFRSDSRLLKKHRIYSSTYIKSGYDRGHMAPAMNFRYSKTAEHASFVMSNVVPQLPGVNRGIWKTVELRVREHVRSIGDLIVIDGPIYSMHVHLTNNHLRIPVAFYKIIITKIPRKTLAFIIPNQKPKKNYKLTRYAVSIDEIEKTTHINFLSDLSISDQTRLEFNISSGVDWPIILK